mmetsp:Transcript_74849/g.216370  ORF Transcript_74849/g.216370 Transcript_74849/m.216370 type:complete len:206 (+) Transcript_74849:71-688(+)
MRPLPTLAAVALAFCAPLPAARAARYSSAGAWSRQDGRALREVTAVGPSGVQKQALRGPPCCGATSSGSVLYRIGDELLVGAIGTSGAVLPMRASMQVPRMQHACPRVHLSPDSRSALLDVNTEVLLWAFDEGREPRPVPRGAMFSADGAILVGHLSDSGLRLLDIGSGAELHAAGSASAPLSLGGDRRLLAVSDAHSFEVTAGA